jgi:hypothetical protein
MVGCFCELPSSQERHTDKKGVVSTGKQRKCSITFSIKKIPRGGEKGFLSCDCSENKNKAAIFLTLTMKMQQDMFFLTLTTNGSQWGLWLRWPLLFIGKCLMSR